jgi:hypothetical protein
LLHSSVEVKRPIAIRIEVLQIRPCDNELPTFGMPHGFEKLSAEQDIGCNERRDIRYFMFASSNCG